MSCPGALMQKHRARSGHKQLLIAGTQKSLTISAVFRLLHLFRPVKRSTFEQGLNLATHLRTC